MLRPFRALLLAPAGLAGLAILPAAAEVELSFYTGVQESPHSRVEGNDPGGIGDYSFLAEWEGRSFEAPPYYGVRGTWWRNENLGFGLEFTHQKVYATDDTMSDNGLSTLEMTDGVNTVIANAMYRWPGTRAWTPYVGGGIGFNVPHVEVTTAGGKTFEYQYGGLSAAALAGVSYAFNDSWSVFGEYRFTYNRIDVDLDNGGTLKTDLLTNAVNLGVSYRF